MACYNRRRTLGLTQTLYDRDSLLNQAPAGGWGVLITPDGQTVTPVQYAQMYYPDITHMVIQAYNNAHLSTNGPLFNPTTGEQIWEDEALALGVIGSKYNKLTAPYETGIVQTPQVGLVFPAPASSGTPWGAIALGLGALVLLRGRRAA
jgi:hypothetical protein